MSVESSANARWYLYNAGRRWKNLRRRVSEKPDHRGDLLARVPRGGVCAEIGVWQGEFSVRILAMTAPSKLHLIDPWTFQPEFRARGYGGKVAKSQAEMDRLYEQVRARFATLANVAIYRDTSVHALGEFRDGFFDWVYIDGNHYYDYVRTDLHLALQKVRPGGLITGDDYDWGASDGFPVRRAVHDFLRDNAIGTKVQIMGSQFLINRP